MNVSKLIEILAKYPNNFIVDHIDYDENNRTDLTVDVYDNETGESFFDMIDVSASGKSTDKWKE